MKLSSYRRKQIAAVYTRAAKRIASADNIYACLAVEDTGSKHWFKCLVALRETYCADAGGGTYWWPDRYGVGDRYGDERNLAQTDRVIGLLLMAHLTLDGQLDEFFTT